MGINEYIKKLTDLFARGAKEEADYFIENLAALLDAGMGFVAALDAVAKDIKSPSIRRQIEIVHSSVKSGEPFWKSIQKTNLVPEYAISIIKFGEESGKLTQNLYVVAKYQQKQRVFKSKLFAAMSYPGLVFLITTVVGILIAWFVLPNLKNVFSQLDLKLPLITKILLGIGGILSKYGLFVVPGFLLLVAASVYLLFFNPATRHIGQSFLFFIPLTRRLMQEIEIARFAEGLGLLLESGAPSITAFDSVADSASFRMYRRLYKHIRKIFSGGGGLAEAFSSYPGVERLFPISVVQIIATGEQSGKLSKNLLRIGERYEEKLEVTTKNLPMILEPILLFIVWGGVLTVAIAVVLPLYQLIGQL